MFNRRISIFLVISLLAALFVPVTVHADDSTYRGRFEELYKNIMTDGAKNGYLSPDEGAPYHSVETMIVEAPDYGHVTTSEAFSYMVWLAAMHGRITGDFKDVAKSWQVMDKCMIPESSEQPGYGNATEVKGSYASEYTDPAKYPSKMDHNNAGVNPIFSELKSAYKNGPMYSMHWVADVDNWYEYGTGTQFTFINTFQRGEQESTWETIPHPSLEEFKFGGKNGFLDLFVGDANGYSKQWRYTNAPDADLRAIQAVYWANKWSNNSSSVSSVVEKAGKMGDYLRNNLFDKYYKKIGCQDKSSPSAGYDSAHYLVNWYTAWGGDINGQWAFQIGCSHNHFFYQNPMATWALLNDAKMKSAMKSKNAVKDWTTSLDRQLEMITWLQSPEGPIAGGCTNMHNGDYSKYPSNASTFYDMIYEPHPVYKDPGSNKWIGTQVWGLQRVAELYYETGNEMAKDILDRWVKWVKTEVKLNSDGTFQIPSDLEWSGQPDTWNGSRSDNSNLSVKVIAYGTDIGCIGAMANLLLFYAAKSGDTEAKNLAKELLDRSWKLFRDDIGLTSPEKRADYVRFFEQEVFVPSGWTGKMGNGDQIKSGVTFLDIRSKYLDDPDYDKIKSAYEYGEDPEVSYHRFWHQADMAMAIGTMDLLFPDEIPDNGGEPSNPPSNPPTASSGGNGSGDLNGDNKVNSTDYSLLRRHILSLTELTGNALKAADLNGDGKVNSTDYSFLRRVILGIN